MWAGFCLGNLDSWGSQYFQHPGYCPHFNLVCWTHRGNSFNSNAKLNSVEFRSTTVETINTHTGTSKDEEEVHEGSQAESAFGNLFKVSSKTSMLLCMAATNYYFHYQLSKSICWLFPWWFGLLFSSIKCHRIVKTFPSSFPKGQVDIFKCLICLTSSLKPKDILFTSIED